MPAAASFATMLGVPVVLLGFTNPDDQAHAPNEQMVLANYEGGARTIVRYWEALADPSHTRPRPSVSDGVVGTDGMGL
ncbi:MAG: hypothetical protein U0869_07150 [Chloroflexota bacterium]